MRIAALETKLRADVNGLAVLLLHFRERNQITVLLITHACGHIEVARYAVAARDIQQLIVRSLPGTNSFCFIKCYARTKSAWAPFRTRRRFKFRKIGDGSLREAARKNWRSRAR